MSLRPVPARWFRVLAPRTDAARVTSALARTGAVEIEVVDRGQLATEYGELAAGLQQYRERLGHYAPYWARGRLRDAAVTSAPRETLERALAAIENWRAEADGLIARLQAAEEERARLRLWERVLGCGEERTVDFRLIARAGPVLDALIALLPPGTSLPEATPCLTLALPLGEETCVLAVGPAPLVRELGDRVRALKGRLLERPTWMAGSAREVGALTATRALRLDLEVRRLYAELDALHEDCGLPEALSDLTCLEWFAAHVGPLPATDRMAWVTGWTDDLDGRRLAAALEREGVRGLFSLAAAPPAAHPPQLLRNPAWIRPFEVFARALGTPGETEADPTPWVAVVAPLLFGYMFGDLGQGLVLFGAGWWLRERGPLAHLLMAGGLSAAAFGLLFGSVFSREDVLPPLWFSPMHDPLLALGVPLAFGAALLVLGQVLSAFEARWRGELRHWLLAEGGLLAGYLGLLGAVVEPRLIALALAGAAWHLAGHALLRARLAGALAGLGTLLEDGMRLLVNTLSFARVGAFALAHGGLSAAVVTLADTAGSELGALLILLLGNALIIGLEGLVVSIQTTRLVLFEFFVRFLRGEGRSFRPLTAPPAVVREETYEIAR